MIGASLSSALTAAPVIAGFDATRGGVESLSGEDIGLANDISTTFPRTTFRFANTLSPTFLNGAKRGEPGRRLIGLQRNHAALDFRAKRTSEFRAQRRRRDYGDYILD
ncbi:MAG TPA: hypothetical protein VGG77_11980 [Roseiarcus sp.]|jgi:hypothetical protein